MKKIILSTAVFISGLVFLNAQSDSKEVQFGVKGGLNSSTISGDDFGDLESRTSFNVGVLAEVPISERLSFQPEVFYSGQGFDVAENDQDNIFDTNDNIEYQLDYIQVPLLLKAYLVKGLSVEVGPQFGFKIHEELDFQPTNDGGDIEINSEDSYVKDFSTSVALGASYKFDSGLFVNGRYNFGVTDIFDDNTPFQGIDAKNNVLQVGLGFMF
ncbi:outer membrane protein with beta-barrel domain [Lacinutrix venerupis]|uniref:porin family protein n=1 Tax=Lacinutrix venerupis TaxID=1486034 RepID=UPI000EB2575E|nr:porin family protein [Lacinutrix venerupis]RLJ69083.1 outer membrane protein with beta-barrel domain [Lacinutrix venerupis]